MTVVMQLLGLINGPPTGFDGQWLVEYDPERDGIDDEGRPMFAHIVTTPDPEQAHQFADHGEAFECWRRVCQRAPRRPDGRPNRPLTAFTTEIVSLEKARAGR